MNEEHLRAAYRRAMDARPHERSGCPAPDALAAVIEGTASEAERLETLRHIGGCAACRADFELLRTAGDVAERVMRPWWTSRPVMALAAALVLAVGGVALWQRSGGGPPDGDILRNGPGAGALTLLAPTEGDAVTLPVRLVWAAVPGARRYDVEVLDPAGAVLLHGSTTDTLLNVTEPGPLTAGVEYRWWVQAGMADGRQPRSVVRRFRLTARP